MEATAIVTPDSYHQQIRAALGDCLVETALYPRGKRRGKVRYQYDRGGHKDLRALH